MDKEQKPASCHAHTHENTVTAAVWRQGTVTSGSAPRVAEMTFAVGCPVGSQHQHCCRRCGHRGRQNGQGAQPLWCSFGAGARRHAREKKVEPSALRQEARGGGQKGVPGSGTQRGTEARWLPRPSQGPTQHVAWAASLQGLLVWALGAEGPRQCQGWA